MKKILSLFLVCMSFAAHAQLLTAKRIVLSDDITLKGVKVTDIQNSGSPSISKVPTSKWVADYLDANGSSVDLTPYMKYVDTPGLTLPYRNALNSHAATLASHTSSIATNTANIATNTSNIASNTTAIAGKQATLVSGTNLKTVAGISLLGSGDIPISASPGGSNTQIQFNNSGAFSGSSSLTWDGSTTALRVGSFSVSDAPNINTVKGFFNGDVYATQSGGGFGTALQYNGLYCNIGYGSNNPSLRATSGLFTVNVNLAAQGITGTSITATGAYIVGHAGFIRNDADDKYLTIRGGLSNGAYIEPHGNTESSLPGTMKVFAGSSGTIRIGIGSTEYARIGNGGSLLLGTTSESASSKLTVVSTTQGVNVFPAQTTSNRNAISSPDNGLKVYNTSTNTNDTYDGTRWTQGAKILPGSGALDFISTATGTSSDLSITVTGAADGDVVSLAVPNASVYANSCYTAWVSATDTVTVRFNNYSSSTIDPASSTFRVLVFKN